MTWIVNNWYVLIVLAIVIVESIFERQRVLEWLLGAVTDAEASMGSGTGVLKLRQVYDLFITKFPVMSKIISFNSFSKLVDIALDEMKAQLQKNAKIKNYVDGE